MKNRELVKNIMELISTKKGLLEGDELDLVYEHDIEVLEAALEVINKKPRGVWIATMDSECYEWKAVGRTENEAIDAIVKEWNSSSRRVPMTKEELEDYYGIDCEFIKYGKCEWR